MPEVGSECKTAVGLVEARRRFVFGPTQCDEGRVTLMQSCACAGAAAFETEPQVGRQRQCQVLALGRGNAYAVAVAGVLPLDWDAAVLELWFAFHLHFDVAVDAAHSSQQHVVGVGIGW